MGYDPCFEKAQVAHVIETEARVEIAIQVEHALLAYTLITVVPADGGQLRRCGGHKECDHHEYWA